jgi:hypothetical protein
MPKRPNDSRRSPGWHWLTRLAFLIALAVVIARLMTAEVIRNPTQAVAGDQAAPIGPGPATGLVLDLIATSPALLILARRAIDSQYRLRHSWAAIAFLLLGLWAVCSTLWSADKFAAIVSSMHWLAAMVLLWSSMQLVVTPLRLRIVAGVAIGVLLVLTVSGYYFRLVDWRDLQTAWDTNRADILREHNWTADSFEAKQFEMRIRNGEPMGFSASPNTYAALLALLGTIAAGAAIQKIRDHDAGGWIAAPIVCVVLALPCLILSGSKGAGGTAILAAIVLGVCAAHPEALRHQSRKIYWLGWAAVVLFGCALVGHGLYHHTLFHVSLTFRWQYWVGAARLIAAHPLRGVGFENFGSRYLAYRLPIASEEVRDPHNFIVRIVAELGIIGGVLLALALLRLAWETTQLPLRMAAPTADDADWLPRAARQLATRRIVGIATAAIALNVLASVDFESTGAFVFIELMRRMLFWLLLLVGISAGSLRLAVAHRRHLRSDEIEYYSDDRSAPWILYAILVALAMFLIHNLIDFALFEPGPMLLFGLLAGSALGVRRPPEDASGSGRIWAVLLALGSAFVWLAVAALIATPIITSESLAQDADEAIHKNLPDIAADKLELAFKTVPYNYDYALHAATLRAGQHNARRAYDLLSSAIAANPAAPEAYLWRAQLAPYVAGAAPSQPVEDMSQVVMLDPQNVEFHEHYAAILAASRDLGAARHQYDLAVQADDALEAPNPKRRTAALHRRYGDLLQQYKMSAAAKEQYKLALQANEKLDPRDPRRLENADPKALDALRQLAAGQ